MDVKEKIRKTHAPQRVLFSFIVVMGLLHATAKAQTNASLPATQPATDSASTTDLCLTGDWFGWRTKLQNHGVFFTGDIIFDGSKNVQGGIDTAGTEWRHLFEVTASVDTELLIGFKGGTLFADFQNQSGRNASQTLTGDFQLFDNIDADGRTQLAQLWYQQVLLDGRLRIKAGKVDAASEFDKSYNAGEFINSSAGYSASLITLPTYPDPATAVNIFLYPGKGFYAGVGVYDGSAARGIKTGENGPKTFFHDLNDLYFITEAGKRWGDDSGYVGRLGIGGWYNSNHFHRFDGGSQTGASGFYAIFDQTIYRPDSGTSSDCRGIGVFVMTGTADAAVSRVDFHFGSGVAWTGAIPHRDRDVMGVCVQAVRFSKSADTVSDHEVDVEGFYRLQILPWVMVKPDVQYIMSPGGSRLTDAVVGTIRCELDF